MESTTGVAPTSRKSPLSDLHLTPEERNCLDQLGSLHDVLEAVQVVEWNPQAPVDVRFWFQIIYAIEDGIGSLIKSYPDVLVTRKRGGLDLEPHERKLKGGVRFMISLLNWTDATDRYTLGGVFAELIQARDAGLAALALELCAVANDSRPLSWRHRLAGTRWFRAKEWRFQASSEKLLYALDGYAHDVFRVSPAESERGEHATDDLRGATLAFDEEASADPAFDYATKGFAALLDHRARIAPAWFAQFRLVFHLFEFATGASKHARAATIRKSFDILFTEPAARTFDLMAACRVLEASRSSVTKSSLLLSRVPGRGALIESTRKMIAEADAEFETKIGLSFARAADKVSSDLFWFSLEARLVLCTMLTGHETTYGLLMEGGVFKVILQWLKRALAEEEHDEDAETEGTVSGKRAEDGRYFALTAACFFFINVILVHPDALDSVNEIADLVSGAEKLSVNICSQKQPSFAQKNLLAALISAVGSGYQVLRKHNTQVTGTVLNIEADQSPVRNLLVLCIDNSLKLGGAIAQAVGECLSEISRANVRMENAMKNGLRTAIQDLIAHSIERCPAENQEALFAIAWHYYTLIRKTSALSMRSGAALVPALHLDKLLSTMRDPRFSFTFSCPWNDLGVALRQFLSGAPECVSKCVEALKSSFDAIGRGEGGVQAWEQTARCCSTIFTIPGAAKAFLQQDGLHAVCSSLGKANISRRTFKALDELILILAVAARLDTMEALSQQICRSLDEEKPIEMGGPHRTWVVFLCEAFLSILNLSAAPTRHARETVLGNEACMRALDAIEAWDTACEFPTRSYAGCLARIASSLTGRTNGLFNSYAGMRPRPAHETAVIMHLVKAVESCLARDPARALVRMRNIYHSALLPVLDDFLRALSDKGALESLIRVACDGLAGNGTGKHSVDILSHLCEPAVFKTADFPDENHDMAVAHASYALGRMLLSNFDRINFDNLLDNVFTQFACNVLAKLVKSRESWRPVDDRKMKKEFEEKQVQKSKREQQQQQPPPPFKADRAVVSSLIDMGFAPALAIDAQERLRSNNLEELAMHLVENIREITEEDELKVAMWLSEESNEGAADAEKTDAEAAATEAPAEAVETLNEEERAAQELLDTEEHAAKQILATVVSKVKARAKLVGSKRGRLDMPWDACISTLSKASSLRSALGGIPDELPHFAFTGDALVLVTNQTDSVLRVKLDPGGATAERGLAYLSDRFIDIQPGEVDSPINTFVDALLLVTLASEPDKQLGIIPALWCDVHVTIPRGAVLLERKIAHVVMSEFPQGRVRPSWTRRGGERDGEMVEVTLINPVSVDIVAIPLGNIPGEQVIIPPRSSIVRQTRRDEVWFFHTLYTQQVLGFAAMDKHRRPPKTEKGFFPTHFVILADSPAPPRIYTTMAMAMSQLIQDEKEGGAYLASISSNLIATSAMLRVYERHTEWLKTINLREFLESVWQSIQGPHRGVARTAGPNSAESRPATKQAVASGAGDGRKRQAAEAELLEEDRVVAMEEERETNQETSTSTKRKKSHTIQSEMLSSPHDEIESPRRAHGLKTIAFVFACDPEIRESMAPVLAASLEVLNALESESLLLTLANQATSALSLRAVIANVLKFGVSDAARVCVPQMVRTEDDDAFAYRVRAAHAFRKLSALKQSATPAATAATATTACAPAETTETRVTMDAFVKNLGLTASEQPRFSEAVANGFLTLDSATGDIIGCTSPSINTTLGSQTAEELMRLLAEHPTFTAAILYLLRESLSSAPRLTHFLYHSPLFSIVLSFLTMPLSANWPLQQYLVDIMCLTASFVPESHPVMARAVVEAVQTVQTVAAVSQLGQLVPAFMQRSPLLALAFDAADIADVVLARLSEESLALERPGGCTESNVHALASMLRTVANSSIRKLVASNSPEKFAELVSQQQDIFAKNSAAKHADHLETVARNLEPDSDDTQNGTDTSNMLAFDDEVGEGEGEEDDEDDRLLPESGEPIFEAFDGGLPDPGSLLLSSGRADRLPMFGRGFHGAGGGVGGGGALHAGLGVRFPPPRLNGQIQQQQYRATRMAQAPEPVAGTEVNRQQRRHAISEDEPGVSADDLLHRLAPDNLLQRMGMLADFQMSRMEDGARLTFRISSDGSAAPAMFGSTPAEHRGRLANSGGVFGNMRRALARHGSARDEDQEVADDDNNQ